MRLVILSDIHGNNVALRKVLKSIEGRGETVVCLGDVAWGGPQPSEVIGEIRRLSCPVVMGNADEFLIGRGKERIVGRWKQVEDWCNQLLSDDDRAFIRTFEPTVKVNLKGSEDVALCYHGSPRSNKEGILPTTTDAEVASMFTGYQEKVLIGGHTHSQMFRQYADRLLINPGSVGLPIAYTVDETKRRNSAWAEFATLDYDDNRGGGLSVSLKRVEYDFQELEDAITASGMPHREWWIKDWK